MTTRPQQFRGLGLSLAWRLYLLLAAVCVPAFLVYNFYNLGAIEAWRDRQVQEIAAICQFRIEDRLKSLGELSFHVSRREALAKELQRIVEGPSGVDSISVFEKGSTAELSLVASHGAFAPLSPTLEDRKTSIDEVTRNVTAVRKGEEYRAISAAIRSGSPLRGTIHLEISPDKVAPAVPALRRSTILSAGGLLLAIGLGVICFFHFAVGKPVRRLMAAMQSATEGDLTSVVEVSAGELGRLGHSYNHMMLQLRSSMDANRKLLEQVRGFNDELQNKVKEATKALESKNLQLHAANEKLFSTQRQLTRLEKLASLGQASTVLAHELGTPLNAISGHLQLLSEEVAAEGHVQDRLRVIEEQVDRLTRIVRDVLETMRMPPSRKSDIDLSSAVKGVIDLISPLAEKQGIRVETQIEAGLPPLNADPGQIEQLFMNLFTNAMDAMKTGGTLRVSTAVVEGVDPEGDAPLPHGDGSAVHRRWIQVDVQDSGHGMPPEVVEKIFEPFYSTKRQGTAQPPGGIKAGLGLGLSISEQIVKNHGGVIRVESQEGKGALFRILFPVDSGES